MSSSIKPAAAQLRVSCRNLVARLGKKSVVVSASTTYSSQIGGRVISKLDDPDKNPFIINAEVVHGDEQAYWTARRHRSMVLPYWDRVAQAAIVLSRRAARVPQEAAFRLMAVYLKMLMIVKITDISAMMLPLWMSHNVQGLLGKELEKKNGDGEPPKGEAASPAAADAGTAAAPVSESPKV